MSAIQNFSVVQFNLCTILKHGRFKLIEMKREGTEEEEKEEIEVEERKRRKRTIYSIKFLEIIKMNMVFTIYFNSYSLHHWSSNTQAVPSTSIGPLTTHAASTTGVKSTTTTATTTVKTTTTTKTTKTRIIAKRKKKKKGRRGKRKRRKDDNTLSFCSGGGVKTSTTGLYQLLVIK
ncbi:hypothetical protein ACTFIZ_001391 [Dictyostelium cf. discoideum]